jgi:hypothetical protein
MAPILPQKGSPLQASLVVTAPTILGSMRMQTMRLTRTIFTSTLIFLALSGCGNGSGLVGIAIGGGGGGTNGSVAISFFVQPNSATVGQVISPPVEVLVRDSVGATDSAFTSTISVALGSDSTGATLNGTTDVRPVNGIASFSNLSINRAGTYTLTASTSGSAAVTSTAFSIQ